MLDIDTEICLIVTNRQLRIIREQISRAMVHSIREGDRQDTDYYKELETLYKIINDQYDICGEMYDKIS